MKRSRVARRGFSVALRVAACLLLTVICADLVADTACDSSGFGAPSATTLRGAVPAAANEPCADVCVPDCFCCSRPVVAGAVVLPPGPERLDSVDAPVAKRRPEGVRPVIDHPPLARA